MIGGRGHTYHQYRPRHLSYAKADDKVSKVNALLLSQSGRLSRRALGRDPLCLLVRPGGDMAALLQSGGVAHKRRRQIGKTQQVLQALANNDVFAPEDVRGDRVADLKRQ